MLFISSLNYPGGEAISRLHTHLDKTPWTTPLTGNETIKVHMDVLSCMTGVNRFQELPWRGVIVKELPIVNDRPVQMVYDKTEDPKELLKPEFWAQFDYLLMEDPTKAIGAWEVVQTIYAYAGIEFLRPGDGSSFSENLERVYAANNITTSKNGEDKPPTSGDVQKALKEGRGIDRGSEESEEEADKKSRLILQELGTFGTYKLIRDAVRQVTGGYWIGPRMEPTIRILSKVQDPLKV
jgi:alpha-1,6-mannosyltransferase